MTKARRFETSASVEIPTPPASSSPGMVGHRFRLSSSDAGADWLGYDHAVVAFIESGLLGLRTEDESLILSSGMMAYLPPGCRHQRREIGVVEGWSLALPRWKVQQMPDRLFLMDASPLLIEMCVRIVSWGVGWNGRRTPEQARLIGAFLDELKATPPASHLNVPFPKSPSLVTVAKRVSSTPDDRHTIDHWAKVSGMSRRTFTDRFAEETGLSFAIWRQRVRLQAGLKKMAVGKTVAEAAAESGFASASAFIQIFRKQFGITPKQYILKGAFASSSLR